MALSAPTVVGAARGERAAIVKTELKDNLELASIIDSYQADAL